MNEKIGKILSKMTLEEKISLCNGADFWHSKAMEQYGIPAITMSDGPHALNQRPAFPLPLPAEQRGMQRC